MVSLTSSLRGQLLKCFINILIFFVEKIKEAFALQKFLIFFFFFFSTKIFGNFQILAFEILTMDGRMICDFTSIFLTVFQSYQDSGK